MRIYITAIALFLLLPCAVSAEFLTFDDQAMWQANWSLKPRLNIFSDEGHLGLVRFNKDINAVADAHLFVHVSHACVRRARNRFRYRRDRLALRV